MPLGLVLATNFSWHVPFCATAGLCVPILLTVSRCVPALLGHLDHARGQHPLARMLAVQLEPTHRMAFVFMAALTAAGFTIFPTVAPYMVQNVGLKEEQVPFIQRFSCGLAAWLTGNIISQGPNGQITGYPVAGVVSVTLVLTCIWLARFLRPTPAELSTGAVSIA